MDESEFPENMACATVNAAHLATSVTVLAFLAAHQPQRHLTFKVFAPDAAKAEHWAEILQEGKTGIALAGASQGSTTFAATATGQLWSETFRTHASAMGEDNILFMPSRPGKQ